MPNTTTFKDNAPATNGPFIGLYLWDSAANWVNSLVPANGDTVLAAASSLDDIAGLQLAGLTIQSESLGIAAALTIGTLMFTPTVLHTFEFVNIVNGATLTVQTIDVAGGIITAQGAGSALVDNSGADPGETYTVSGGRIELHNTVNNASTLDFTAGGTIALFHPGPTVGALLSKLSASGTIELPGTTVRSVTFSGLVTKQIVVTTDVGQVSFTNLTYSGSAATNYSFKHDATTGLEAITFRPPDVFSHTALGPGNYFWSNAANWSVGLPIAGDTVDTARLSGADDLSSLSLATLVALAPLETEGALTVGTLDVGSTSAITIGDLGTGSLTVGALSGAGASITVEGVGSQFIDSAASDPGGIYAVLGGGTIELHAPVANTSTLAFVGTGVIALFAPAATTSALLSGVTHGSTLEVPGTSVSSVVFAPPSAGGIASFVVTTNLGSYAFADVTYGDLPAVGYSATHDNATGLEAITFRQPDVFARIISRVAQYDWSAPENWSDGPPIANDTVVASVAGADDIAGLSLASLTDVGARLDVLAALTVGTLTVGTGTVVAAEASGPSVTLNGLVGAGATLEAIGPMTALLDRAATDPGESYVAGGGGVVQIGGTLSGASSMAFGIGGGTIALLAPGPTVAAQLAQVGAADTLELPGSTLTGFQAGPHSLTVSTDQGSVSFSNVSFATPLTGISTRVDPATGLLALAFDATDAFTRSAVAVSTPFGGQYLWSNAGNWSLGVPTYGSGVAMGVSGTDDLVSLSVQSLTLTSAATLTAVGGSLGIGTLALDGTGGIDVAPFTGSATVLIGALTGTTATSRLEADARATLTVQGTTDPGATYAVSAGGTVVVTAPLAAASALAYAGAGDIVLPGAQAQAQFAGAVAGLAPGDTLDLPGTSVSRVAIGANSLTIVTNAGTFTAGNVSFASPVGGYTATADTYGAVAIAFTATDTFQQAVTATSGPATGGFIWSNGANWSSGVPASGAAASVGALGYDDVANLSLSTLTETAGGGVIVVGGALTLGTVAAGAGSELLALGASAGAFVVVNAIAGTGGLYGAAGVDAAFADFAAADPGETYLAQAGGTVKLAAAPAAASTLQFAGAGTIELFAPSPTVAAAVTGIAAGDRLELPGASVGAVSLGANSLSVTTNLGTTSFTNLAFAGGVTGVAVGHDAASGLATLTFTDQARAARPERRRHVGPALAGGQRRADRLHDGERQHHRGGDRRIAGFQLQVPCRRRLPWRRDRRPALAGGERRHRRLRDAERRDQRGLGGGGARSDVPVPRRRRLQRRRHDGPALAGGERRDRGLHDAERGDHGGDGRGLARPDLEVPRRRGLQRRRHRGPALAGREWGGGRLRHEQRHDHHRQRGGFVRCVDEVPRRRRLQRGR